MLDIIRNRAQSWGVKIIFGIIILVFVFWGMGSFTSNNPDIIMRVNGKIINRQAYGEELKRYAQAVKARMPNLPNEYFESEEQRRRVLGIMVDKGNEQQLSNAILAFAQNNTQFDRNYIRNYAVENYSYEKIGKKLSEIYELALQNK